MSSFNIVLRRFKSPQGYVSVWVLMFLSNPLKPIVWKSQHHLNFSYCTTNLQIGPLFNSAILLEEKCIYRTCTGLPIKAIHSHKLQTFLEEHLFVSLDWAYQQVNEIRKCFVIFEIFELTNSACTSIWNNMFSVKIVPSCFFFFPKYLQIWQQIWILDRVYVILAYYF